MRAATLPNTSSEEHLSAGVAVPRRHMVQLDSLRALAALSVLFFHFYVGENTGENAAQLGWIGRVPWGEMGVRLFFVLSGFLITGILLECRDLSRKEQTPWFQMRQFYVRRSLRIFPLFYFVTLAAAALNISPVRETLWWHLTYTSNFYFGFANQFAGPVSHFWSLAVEEQFYLFWPFLIVFLPPRWILPCILAAIFSAPAYRLSAGHFGLNQFFLSAMMISNLDFLGIGALLAFWRYRNPANFETVAQSKYYLVLGVMFLFFMVALLFIGAASRLAVLVNMIVPPVFFAWLIHKASVGFGGIMGRFLSARPLRYCGKISYGIYIYHPFMLVLLVEACRYFHFPYLQDRVLKFLVLTAITIVVASCSWWVLERPILNLKNRFRYSKT